MIALDIESSGLDPHTYSILSIGAVDTDNPSNQFYDECRPWDGAELSDEALAINGFKREELQSYEKKTEAELVRDFIAWAMDRPGNRTLVAQTPGFDAGFLRAAVERAGLEYPFAARTIDTHTLCWLHMTMRGVEPPQNKQHSELSLDAVLAYCGIPAEPKPHNALTGALSHAEAFARIAYTKKLLPDFEPYDLPWQPI